MFGNMGNSSFAFINSIAASFNDPAARATAYNPFPQNQTQNTYSPGNYSMPVTTYVPGPPITSPTRVPTNPIPNTSPLTGMSTNYGGGGSTRTFNQQDRDLIISSGNAAAAGISTGVPTGTRTTTVTPTPQPTPEPSPQPVVTESNISQTIVRSTPTTSGNSSNQPTIFFDEGGESDSGGGTGINVGLGDSGAGNRNISVRSSKVRRDLYGPYSDFCSAYAGRKRMGRRTVYIDNASDPTYQAYDFYGSSTNADSRFIGRNKFYYDDTYGGVVQIGFGGQSMGTKDEEELLDDCEVKVPIKPKKVSVTLNFKKGNNHPSPQSIVNPAGQFTSRVSGTIDRTGGSRTEVVELTPVSAGLQTTFFRAYNGTVNNGSITEYKLEYYGKWYFKLYKRTNINGSPTAYSVVSTQKITDKGNSVSPTSISFDLSFDYLKITPPPKRSLTVSPPTVNLKGTGQVRGSFSIISSHLTKVNAINGATNVKHSAQRQGPDGKYISTVDYIIPAASEFESFSGEQEVYTFKVMHTDVSGPGQAGTYAQHMVYQPKLIEIKVDPPKSYPVQFKVRYKLGENGVKSATINCAGDSSMNGRIGETKTTSKVQFSETFTGSQRAFTWTASYPNRIGIDTYTANVVGSNRNPGPSSLEIYRNGKLFAKQDLTFGQYGFRGSLVYDAGNQPIDLLFGFNTVVRDEEKDPAQLIIRSNINTGDWGYIEIQDFDGDTIYTANINEFDSDDFSIISSDAKLGFQYKVNLNKGFVVEKIEQKSPVVRAVDPKLLGTGFRQVSDGTVDSYQVSVRREVNEEVKPEVFPARTTFEYPINSGANVNIPYSSRNTSYVNFKLPFNEVNNQPANGNFKLDDKYFTKGLGRYLINLCPYGPNGEKGEEKQVEINVVRKETTNFPDIRKISYPKLIKGKDFIGLNVPFSFSYQSVYTDYVQVFLHDKGTRIGGNRSATDVIKLNVQDLVKYTNKFTKSGDKYTFNFLLVPFGKGNGKTLEGKTEQITIVFDEGDFTLNRDEVIDRICKSVAAQLDPDFFDGRTSKLLTHLLHFGDANNEVISNWEADTETFREYKVDPKTGRETNEKKEGGFDALVLKMYEPLETTVQPNQQVWITKIQSKPQIHEVILRESQEDSCPPLAAPNFTIDVSSGMQYEIFDDILAVSESATNASLVNTFVSQSGIDTTKLDIDYISGSITYNTSSNSYESASLQLAYENFSHFGSAEERIKNFYYKVGLIENYTNISASLETGSSKTSLSVVAEKQRQIRKINEVKAGFDGFESFLYTDTGSLAYPKNSDGNLLGTGSSDALAWYNNNVFSASKYDYDNVNYLPNNIPQFVKDDEENGEFIMFLDMIGQHFDILWTYVESINRTRKIEHKQKSGLSDELVREMLRSFGYKPNSSIETAPLWEFALGQYNSANSARTDGTSQSVMTGKDRQNQIWRRILNNLPYLYKSKGTKRGLQATLATYGIGENLLRIKEFGGPPAQLTTLTKIKNTERVNSAQLVSNANSKVIIPWHTGSSYPQTIEFSLQTDTKQNAKIISHDNFYLTLNTDTGSQATFTFHITGSDTSLSASTAPISFFNEEINTFMIRRSATAVNEVFDIFVKEPRAKRIRAEVSQSVSTAIGQSGWGSGSTLEIGGVVGAIDNIKLWKTALSESIFNEHVLAPDMYNGNSITASTEDLFVRLDFEKVKDLSTNDSFSNSGSYKNVAPNTSLYGDTFVTMSNFATSGTYPHSSFEVKTVERTRTIPSVGFGESDKISAINPELKTELSARARATKTLTATTGIESNRIGIFISPTANVNRDIIKALGGTFRLDDFIGDPCDQYEEEYTDLINFRKKFFSKYSINYDGFYNLIKYIDKTLFKTLLGGTPARSKPNTGLLIEPHLLERNKARRKKPSGIVFEEQVGVEDISKGSVISIDGDSIQIEGLYSQSQLQPEFSGDNVNFETTMSHDFVNNLSSETVNFETTMSQDFVNNLTSSFSSIESFITGSAPSPINTTITSVNSNEGSIIFNIPSPLTGSAVGIYVRDAFETVPPQENDYTSFGFGVTGGKNGHSIVTFNTPNGRDKERRKYYLITETETDIFPILNNSNDQSSGYNNQTVTTSKQKITFTSISGSAPSVAGNITAVKPLVGNLPSHYIYVKDTSLGMENSFFNGCKQTQATTIDGGPAFETFVTNPNTLKVSDSGRGSGEPILDVE